MTEAVATNEVPPSLVSQAKPKISVGVLPGLLLFFAICTLAVGIIVGFSFIHNSGLNYAAANTGLIIWGVSVSSALSFWVASDVVRNLRLIAKKLS